MTTKLIIFVCVSNTCRSPMCEYMFRDKIDKIGLQSQVSVASRSLSEDYEPQGSPPNEQGQLVMMNEYGIDTSAHRSKLLSADDVEQAHWIIPVKKDLGEMIKRAYPGHASKVKNLQRDVPDPWRQPYPVYASCATMVDTLLTDVMTDLTAELPSPEL